MQLNQGNHSGNSRLRLVFDETVVSLNLAANATLGDIARTADELATERHGHPVAIDVMFRSGEGHSN